MMIFSLPNALAAGDTYDMSRAKLHTARDLFPCSGFCLLLESDVAQILQNRSHVEDGRYDISVLNK